MPAEWNRDPIKDFILLRPFFTPRRLRIVWFAFLLVWTWQFASQVFITFNTYRSVSSLDLISSLFLTGDLLSKIIYLILVRLLLEVALVLISRSPRKR